MSVNEIVAEYAADRDGRVVVLPSAQDLTAALAGARPWGEDDSPGRGQVVVAVLAADPAEELLALADRLGTGDVAVALLPQVPAGLPVGPLVTSVTTAGLRVLRAEGARLRQGRSLLVLATDPALPVSGYLTGGRVATGESAERRMSNEWMLERLQTRAAVRQLESRLEGATAEAAAVRAERDRFQQEAARSAAELATVSATLRGLKAAQKRSLRARSRKAAQLLRDDPLRGGARLVRGAARRLRR